MDFNYIVVQAGGKGTRLLPLTANRPKSLVPVNNAPILFHLFQKYPEKKFIIIGDYKYDVLSNYLDTYANVNYLLIHANGIGNVTGIKHALSFIPDHEAFMIIWSDLLLDDSFQTDGLEAGCYIGTTNNFKCSWHFENSKLEKISTNANGVAGCFLFDNKKRLRNIPLEGSFTKYLEELKPPLKALDMGTSEELGTLEAIRKIDSTENRCRPYNKMTFTKDLVIKEGLTPEANKLIQREVEWYEAVNSLNFGGIPKIHSLQPLTLARIHGENIFKVSLSDTEKQSVLDNLFERLNELHHLKVGVCDVHDMQEDYYSKTMKRLRSIREVIPFSNEKEIIINGVSCKNIFFYPDQLQKKVDKLLGNGEFGIIHGDCTLTNTLIDAQHNIYFIDARGYFGHTKLMGDVYYDWAKVYYSIQGAFDQFNVKNFELTISNNEVLFKIASSGWEHLTQYFLSKIPCCDIYRLKLIHAIIWLSLASHCWEDFDSLCTAFYNGLYLLNTLED